MVDKNHNLVEAAIFADAHEAYPEDQMDEVYNELFEESGFSSADRLVLTGAPNQNEMEQRREILIEYINKFNDNQKVPVVQTTPEHRKELIKDDRIDEDDYIFESIDPDSSIDELQKTRDRLKPEEQTIIFTSDYHVPRIEKRANSVLSEGGR